MTSPTPTSLYSLLFRCINGEHIYHTHKCRVADRRCWYVGGLPTIDDALLFLYAVLLELYWVTAGLILSLRKRMT